MGATLILTTLLLSATGFAQDKDDFPDIPDNHYAYEFLEDCRRYGVLEQQLWSAFRTEVHPSHRTGPMPVTRRWVAKFAIVMVDDFPSTCARQIRGITESKLEHPEFLGNSFPGPERLKRFFSKTWRRGIERLLVDFSREIKREGADPAVLKTKLKGFDKYARAYVAASEAYVTNRKW